MSIASLIQSSQRGWTAAQILPNITVHFQNSNFTINYFIMITVSGWYTPLPPMVGQSDQCPSLAPVSVSLVVPD